MNRFPAWPSFDQTQIDAASAVLKSGKVNYWTGNECKAFETEFANHANTDYAISLANGSLALSAAYLAIGLGENDEVITTPRTFIATASSAVLLRATPVFADVDPDSGCITAETILPLITPRTKAVSVVHLGGWPADMPAICKVCQEYGLAVIEDCAQAHGARILVDDQWCSVGSFGDVSAWSFCQDKIMTTGGEGGMVTTSRSDLWDQIWSFKDHGKSFDAVHNTAHAPGFRWLHHRFGSNFRLTEFQSAIGRVQLRCLPDWHQQRAQNAAILIDALAELPSLRVPLPKADIDHAWYKFHCYIRPDALKQDWNRNRIIAEINAAGFPALQGSCSEIYLEQCFQQSGLAPVERLPVARMLGETSLMLLVHPTIEKELMQDYAQTVRSVLIRSCR